VAHFHGERLQMPCAGGQFKWSKEGADLFFIADLIETV